MKTSLCAIALLLTAGLSSAAIVAMELQGNGGFGLLASNQFPAVVGGSGGEIGPGITLNDVTGDLTVNVGWGSSNGFTDLTGDAIAGHIHFPTPSAAPGSFSENVGVFIPLDAAPLTWNPSATGGSITGSVNIGVPNIPDFLAGKAYINVHTVANGGGEIRGNLVPVPEPGAALAALLLLAPVAWRERRNFLRCRAMAC
jgi:CHRD domain